MQEAVISWGEIAGVNFDAGASRELQHQSFKSRVPTPIALDTKTTHKMNFIGVTVQITLRNPPNTTIHGRVADIVAGQGISLEDGETLRIAGVRWQ